MLSPPTSNLTRGLLLFAKLRNVAAMEPRREKKQHRNVDRFLTDVGKISYSKRNVGWLVIRIDWDAVGSVQPTTHKR